MSTLQVTGKLYSGTATQQKSEQFSVRTFVLEMSETSNGQTYTNYAQFQLVNNNCAVLDQFQPGQTVTVSFNLRGAFWNDKVITNLNAWKIEHSQQQAPAQPVYQAPPQQPQPAPAWGAPAQPAQPAQWGQPAQPAPAWGAQQQTPNQNPPF